LLNQKRASVSLSSLTISRYDSAVLRVLRVERGSVALHDAMKDYGFSANVVSVGQSVHAEGAILPSPEEAHKSAGREHSGDELATALAMMHATLESTTDAILDRPDHITGGTT
jgi:hypothetical protein